MIIKKLVLIIILIISIPLFSLFIRRSQDTGKSIYFALVSLIPILGVIILGCTRSEESNIFIYKRKDKIIVFNILVGIQVLVTLLNIIYI